MSRRTAFNGSSAARRRERRAHLQSEAAISSEVMHRPTPARVELQCKRKPTMRAEVVTITTQVQRYEGSCCLPEVAIFAAGHRKSKDIVTAR
ncbi:transcriptional antitermination N peptide [Atlantibacter hermannii]|uniref:transcriptional antitermination N peptide n=1 Tax=Atlantibacter hermannii TaxID=565 RepID=UPI0009D999B1|nr:antitermination protein N [Atlantibacter hermannii]QPS90200.1 antitermination protein N [Atlantibacter hermannii]VDZ72963.1 putative transcription antitermination protein N of prophage [Atlantibacter hermannii]